MLAKIAVDNNHALIQPHSPCRRNMKHPAAYAGMAVFLYSMMTPAIAGAATITVGSDKICDYATIQSAVNAATSGDAIRVTNEYFLADNAVFNVIGKSLTIRGGRVSCEVFSSYSGKTTLDGTGMGMADSVVELTDSVGAMSVNLRDFIIRGGKKDGDGGGGLEISGKPSASIAERMDVTLDGVTIFSNTSGNGGGIHVTDSIVVITNESLVHSNHADVDGGGIYCENSDITLLQDSVIGESGALSGNDAVMFGGGVLLDNCSFSLDASDGVSGAYITGNEATGDNGQYGRGGGIAAINGSQVYLEGDKAWVNQNTAISGGGIYAIGGSLVQGFNASIKGNSAGFGGGGFYLSESTISLTRSSAYPCVEKCNELSDNESPNIGGAFYVDSGTAVLDGLWIENNHARHRGMVGVNFQNVTIRNSMIVNNRYSSGTNQYATSVFEHDGRKFSNATLTIEYSTIAENRSGNNGPTNHIFNLVPFDLNIPKLILDSNIIWDNADYLVLTSTDSGVTASQNISDIGHGLNSDPIFMVPGSNFHISASSPAKDYGNELPTTYRDIDGEARGLGETPDAGADEAYAAVGINGAQCQYPTISAAIAAASDGDTLYLPPGTYLESNVNIGKSLTFTQSDLTCQLVPAEPDKADVVIDGSLNFTSSGGIFEIADDKVVTFNSMTLQNAKADYGGIIYAGTRSDLILENVVIQGGTAQQYGGGLRVHGTLRLGKQTLIQNNAAININSASGNAQNGGGIAVSASGTLYYSNSVRIYDNSAGNFGGGIYTEGPFGRVFGHILFRGNDALNGGGIYINGDLDVNLNTTAWSNTASNDGGAIYATGATNITIWWVSSIFLNSAGNNGGGIYLDGNNSLILGTPTTLERGARVSENSADNGFGGGIYARASGNITIEAKSKINNNTAINGAGIYLEQRNTEYAISGGLITENIAVEQGGGLYLGVKTVVLDDLNITMNQANKGGGIFSANTAFAMSLDISNSLITANIAGSGGGLHTADSVQLTVRNSTFSENIGIAGGAMYYSGNFGSPTILLENQTHIVNNTARSGAGVYLSGWSGKMVFFTMRDGVFADNQAERFGGAILSNWGDISIERTLLSGNDAVNSSILDSTESTTTIQNSILYANTAIELVQLRENADLTILDSTLIAEATTHVVSYESPSTHFTTRNSIYSGFSSLALPFKSFSYSCLLDSNGIFGSAALPLFIDGANHDFHLQANSPAIDQCATGTNGDFASNSRPVGAGATPFDIGAHEYQPPGTYYTLSVSVQGSGNVSSNPGGIDCGADCSESYLSGASVNLSATPQAGSIFSEWTGSCTGSGTCNVSMTETRSVQSVFVLDNDRVFKNGFE